MQNETSGCSAGKQGGRAARRLGRLAVVALALAGAGAPGGVVATLEQPAAAVGADLLHAEGITGRGVTVAIVVGPGEGAPPGLRRGLDGRERLLAVRSADPPDRFEGGAVAAVAGAAAAPLAAMLSSRRDPEGRLLGVAPDADFVLLEAASPDDAARAVTWAVANRESYGVRVVVLPFPAAAAGSRRSLDEPVLGDTLLDDALSEAWAAGLVVVAADGGSAPGAPPPGDLYGPIIVGAAWVEDGRWAPLPGRGAGVGAAGFAEPEVLAPAATAAVAAAVAGGVAALLLEARPWLTPDEVERRLLVFARPPGAGSAGAGLLDAPAVVVGPALPAAAAGSPGGLAADDLARDLFWSERAARGMTWSDRAGRGITWSDPAVRGMTWSDHAARGMTWSD